MIGELAPYLGALGVLTILSFVIAVIVRLLGPVTPSVCDPSDYEHDVSGDGAWPKGRAQ